MFKQNGSFLCPRTGGRGKDTINFSLLARRTKKSRAQKISEAEGRAVKMARRVGGGTRRATFEK
ncbi:MAG: hypothetical protein A2784_00195 [Candidatus Chisholmbacteria bacterium RIFCSPHIGHO2_01_FULL_48_12]|uniref:Uncharacterized protein n=1 Tax=Candidatus Chisholmbacteria bacterium RIFCSPHIGHO2_01_FULL_48_12 TaxID=1797589 RepID=A0A1G1VL51_9BACT|nr:MAG: hypothetical protein A2784_00195 [Candidatus Chisholmbacteria bacterium RIFCSPHIGHO2_01_FULL_48_12]